MTGITIYNVQREVTPKVGNLDLWFLCSSPHIMVIYICIKFQATLSNGFQVTERTHILQKSLFSMFKEQIHILQKSLFSMFKGP